MPSGQAGERERARSDAVVLAVAISSSRATSTRDDVGPRHGLDARPLQRPRELRQGIPPRREPLGDQHDLGRRAVVGVSAPSLTGRFESASPVSSSAASSASSAR